MTDNIDLPSIQSAIEQELKECVLHSEDKRYAEYEAMFYYQMDWDVDSAASRGKRVRPLLLLLTVYAAGGDWQNALPAASSLELMHNFSLIHDDIQDKSYTRRGKDTIWVKWGEAQAINCGDALLTLSSLAVHRLIQSCTSDSVLHVDDLIHTACLNLTRGQYLDMSFESKTEVSVDDYFQMISGKTCALLSAALEIGGYLAGTSASNQSLLNKCGSLLGQAYQVQDDWLGIWGDDALTGKSTQSDLLEKKKSYPILLGLEKKQSFYNNWSKKEKISREDIPILISNLEKDGVKHETELLMEALYQQTQAALDQLNFSENRLTPMRDLVKKLVHRNQ